MSLHVAICIVGFRNPGDVADCLQALSHTQHQDFEVVVVENGGEAAFQALSGSTPAALPGGQPVRLVCAPSNLGYAGGVNRCFETAAGADAWWVLNPDTCPEPTALSALVERLGRGDCQAVGGILQLPSGEVQAYGGHWQRLLARAVSIGHGGDIKATVDPQRIEAQQNFLNGASMLIGRRFLETTGPMREDYFLYCEEVEWCLRAASRGMRLGFAPTAIILHKQGTSTGAEVDLRRRSKLSVYLNERNRVLLSRDRFPALLPLAIFTTLATLTLRFGKRRAWRQLGYALEGWAAGVGGQRGVPAWARG